MGDDLLRPLTWLLRALDNAFAAPGSPMAHVGPMATALVVATLAACVALLPFTIAAAIAQRRRWLAPLVTLAMMPLHLAGVVALYLAFGTVAHSVSPGDLHLLGIADITRTPLDLCCAVTPNGQAGAAPVQHADIVNGLLHNPGVVALPALAGILSLTQWLLASRRARGRLSSEARAQRQAALAGPALALALSIALPEAIALALVTQAAFALLCQLAARQVLTGRAPGRNSSSTQTRGRHDAAALEVM